MAQFFLSDTRKRKTSFELYFTLGSKIKPKCLLKTSWKESVITCETLANVSGERKTSEHKVKKYQSDFPQRWKAAKNSLYILSFHPEKLQRAALGTKDFLRNFPSQGQNEAQGCSFRVGGTREGSGKVHPESWMAEMAFSRRNESFSNIRWEREEKTANLGMRNDLYIRKGMGRGWWGRMLLAHSKDANSSRRAPESRWEAIEQPVDGMVALEWHFDCCFCCCRWRLRETLECRLWSVVVLKIMNIIAENARVMPWICRGTDFGWVAGVVINENR